MGSVFRLRFFIGTLALTTVLVLSLIGAASAATYYVSPSGNNSNAGTLANPWRTLTYALDRLSNGDTLMLRGGKYTDKTVNITKNNVTLKNYGNEKPVIDGDFLRPAGFSSPPIKGDSRYPEALWSSLVRVVASGVTLDGLTITESTGIGIHLEQATHTLVKNCTVTYIMHTGIRTGYRNVDAYNIVENNTFTHCNYARDSKVLNLWSNISTAIAVTGNYCEIRNNVVAMNPCAGIEGYMDRYTIIENNIVYGNRLTQIHLAKCDKVTIRNNLLYGTVRSGYTKQYGNLTDTNGTGAGISIRCETWDDESGWNDGHLIYGNKIANACPGLHFGVEGKVGEPYWQKHKLTNCKFYNNTVIEPKKSDTVFPYVLRIRDDGHIGTGNVFKNNIFWQQNGVMTNGGSGRIEFANNLWNKAPTTAFKDSSDSTYNINYAPLSMADYFPKTSGWNSLTANSLTGEEFNILPTAVYAIDKGTSVGINTTLLEGNGDGAIDIGASGYAQAISPLLPVEETILMPPTLSIVSN